jgi:hypothetical protein
VQFKPAVITLWAVCLTLWAGSSEALADGGALRFSGRRGDLLISVFTTPSPLLAGRADVSVLVQGVESGRAITDLAINVRAEHLDRPQVRVSAPATNEQATNKLLRAATLELTDPGRWHVDLTVQGVDPEQPIGFDLDVATATFPWLQTTLWIVWPIVPIVLFATHEFRVRKRRRLLL